MSVMLKNPSRIRLEERKIQESLRTLSIATRKGC